MFKEYIFDSITIILNRILWIDYTMKEKQITNLSTYYTFSNFTGTALSSSTSRITHNYSPQILPYSSFRLEAISKNNGVVGRNEL